MTAGVVAVWLRNAHVWRRSWRTSLVGTLGEPLVYFLGLGYGLGTLIPSVGGQPYLHFVAPGLMLSSAMYGATIEATYNTFTKMEHQRVFASMALAPLGLGEIALGEVGWAATKGVMSGAAVLVLTVLFGIGSPSQAAASLPLVALAGLVFASLGLLVTSVARGYDSFNYYFTLFVSPMFFFSGIFYPVERLGRWVEAAAWFFPLTHLVRLSRSLFFGPPTAPALWRDALWLAVFTSAALFLGVRRVTRRFAG